jgi:hypothetical protein
MRAAESTVFLSRATITSQGLADRGSHLFAEAHLSILGMKAPCLAALSGQSPQPAGARLWARGIDGESVAPSHNLFV